MTEGVVLEIGEQLLGYLAFSGLFITVALAYTGGLQGTGDTKSPLYISLISQIVVPLGDLCRGAGHAWPAACGHLAGDPSWSHHPLNAQFLPVPPGEVETDRGRDRTGARIVERPTLKNATSLGGVERLVEHRAPVEGEGTSVASNLLRLSIGIEDADDLVVGGITAWCPRLLLCPPQS